MATSIVERLLEGVKVNAAGCFEWQRCRDKRGYGRTGIGGDGEVRLAHRIMFEAVRGPASGKVLCHKCDNPCCINPAHLFRGTRLDNARDASSKDRTTHGTKARHAKLDANKVVQIVRLFNEGATHDQIATQFNVSRSVVSEVIEGKTWRRIEKPAPQARASRITKRKIGPNEVRIIRQMCSDGISQSEIARTFGITQVTVSAIKTRRLWPSVV